MTDYDVLIAGGGMIGTSLGLALAPLNLRVGIVEAVARTAEQQPSFDDRSTALSRSSQRAFEAMGLWPEIAAASTAIKHIHVSDKGHFGFSHIDAEEQGVEALGYVVINRVLGQVLQTALSDVAGLDFMCPVTISGVRNRDNEIVATIDDSGKARELTCRLLVAADGANSSVRDMIGISASRIDYDQWAVIGNLLPEKALANRAFERFTATGPLALLPAADDRAAFVWILPSAVAKDALALEDAEFTRRLQETFGNRLGRFSRIGKRAGYPLALTRAKRLIARRSVVIGNAAHGLHPVAAQGFNLGMRDVAALCDCIYDAIIDAGSAQASSDVEAGDQGSAHDLDRRAPPDPGAVAVLDSYAKWRRGDHVKVVRFTDGIVRLFGDRRPPVRVLRNLGMLAFDLVPGVRRLFAKHTMGLAGRLPRLSRGVPLG